MGKKSNKGKGKRGTGGKKKRPSGGAGRDAEAASALFGNAPIPEDGPFARARAATDPVPLPHSISLETNRGVPCWTIDELPAGQQTGWPDCNVCGKPNSSKFCPKCVEWGLPLEVTCSRECFEANYDEHCARLHEPEGEWVAAKGAVIRQAMMGMGGGGPMSMMMYERIFADLEERFPHPRDRNAERQKLGQQGREMVRDFEGWEDMLAELEGSDDGEGSRDVNDSYESESDESLESASQGDEESMVEKPLLLSEANLQTLDAKLEDVKEDTMDEILTYFTLAELDELRKSSKTFHKACDDRKRHVHSHFKKGATVEIVALASAKGKQLNHRLAVINGRLAAGRYPTKIQHLTGEVETIAIKGQNLNPFLDDDQLAKEKTRISFVEYSSDARLREGHGRLLDQILALMRYAVNAVNGYQYFQGDFNEFYALSRGDKRVAACNSQIFSMYRVKPSTAGFKPGVTEDYSILDNTIRTLLSDTSVSLELGAMARYKKDGPGGRLILRNFCRFMDSWDRERIHGEFWIAKIVSSGTLVVQDLDGDLGKVFLVKGIGSQVGEDLPPQMLPFLARTSFLLLYDMLVYDGILVGRGSANGFLKETIAAHVSRAVREQTIVYCGESSALGLWDSEPPELPVIPEPVVTEASDDGCDASYKPTPAERKAASSLLKYAKKIGFKASERPPAPSREKAVLIVRRFGWTRAENPNHRVGLLFTHNQNPDAMWQFQFQLWPCYTLEELLPEILKKSKQERAVPCIIWMDERSLIPRMKAVLRQAAKSLGFSEHISVEWYPPPSEEEQAFVQENPYDTPDTIREGTRPVPPF